MHKSSAPKSARLPAGLITAATIVVCLLLGGIAFAFWREWQVFSLASPEIAWAIRFVLFAAPVSLGVGYAYTGMVILWRRYADHRYIQAAHLEWLTLAQRSQGLPGGVQSLSYHDSHKSEVAPAPPQIEEGGLAQLPDPLSGLGDAITRGWSTPDRWLVGTAGGVPQQIVLKHTGFIAISGVQGTGKTNAGAYLAAQCAAHNGTLYIADPHYGDDESLSARIRPFSGAVARFAMTPDEINAMIAKVDSIYAYRRDHPGAYPPLLLIIDEFMELMIRRQLSPAAIESLLALSGVGRKKHIFCVPIAQNWNLRALGGLGVSVRQSVTHALVFKSSKETAELLLPTSYAQQAIKLKPGKALYFANDEPAYTDVPWLGAEDMELAARGRVPTSYTPAPRAITSGLPAPVAPSQPLPPTQRVARQAAPPTANMQITVPEMILDLLSARGGYMTASEIAAALRIDLQVARVETSTLASAGQLTSRKPSGRRTKERLEYALQLTNKPINARAAISA